ncbi:hypothetical protein MBLNU13_g08301t1 [Cladosporium sp. NU13]
MAAIEQLRELSDRGQDCVCLVENIDKQGIQSLNDLDFPGRNLVGEAANTVFNNDPVRTGNCLQIIDDIVESAEYLGQSVMRRASSKERSRKLQLVEEVLETLHEVSLAVKTSIENWNMSGAYTEDIDCVASCAAELQQTLDRLTQEAASIDDPDEPLGLDDLQMSVRALWKQMQNLKFLRRRRYFNMSARLAYGGSSKTDGRSSGPSAPCGNPCLSLIRVNKCICLVLVDSILTSQARLNFPHANAGNGLNIPELLGARDPSLYGSLQVFAQEAWHAKILCGEANLPPTYYYYLAWTADPSSKRPSKKFAAIDSQAFLVMLASFLWERNLHLLESH